MISQDGLPHGAHQFLDLLAADLREVLSAAKSGAQAAAAMEAGGPALPELARVLGAAKRRLRDLAHLAVDLEALLGARVHFPGAAVPLAEALHRGIGLASRRIVGTSRVQVEFSDPELRVLCDPVDLQIAAVQVLCEAQERALALSSAVTVRVEPGLRPVSSGGDFVKVAVDLRGRAWGGKDGTGAKPEQAVAKCLGRRLAAEAARRNGGGVHWGGEGPGLWSAALWLPAMSFTETSGPLPLH